MYYETPDTQVAKATQQLKELHRTFLRTVLSHSRIPDSHTLLPSIAEKTGESIKDSLSKSELSGHLLHNDPNISERLMTFCARHSLPRAATFSEDDFYSFPMHCYHYILSINPSVNYSDKRKTKVVTNGEEYTFDGFILMSHQQLHHVPPFCFQQYGYSYQMKLEPANEVVAMYTLLDALLFEEYLFNDFLQLYNFTYVLKCLRGRILFIPRFSKTGVKLLSLGSVLKWTIEMRKPLLSYLETALKEKTQKDLNHISDGWIVTSPNSNPSCVRIDRLEWPSNDKESPRVVHFSSVFNEIRSEGESHDRGGHDEVFRVSSKEMILSMSLEGFLLTGIYSDLVQNALLLPQLLGHILYHCSLTDLEETLHYQFQDRQLLERALTLPSYSHLGAVMGEQVKLTASNCGLRRPQIQEDRRNGAGRSVKAVVRSPELYSEEERLRHNEQLEFLGDAALEFLCSLHLYHMLPNAKLGQLAFYRTVLVKNKHLAILARQLELQKYLLMGVTSSSEHSCNRKPPSSTYPSSSNSAGTTTHLESATPMDAVAHRDANTLEAVLGAVYVDGGLSAAQQLTARVFFPEEDLHSVWMGYPPDPLQLELPEGDRHLIAHSPILQQLVELEKLTGVQFRHIRLLAKAFTHSSIQYSSLVGGNYEKLEHLGDAVLQFLASDFVYRKFPTLHEGHLSFLRTTLVQNKQLADLCKQLGFDQYIRTETTEVGVKILADVIESYLAALLLDKGLDYCQRFLEVCLFPKLLEIVEKSTVDDTNTQLQKAVARLCRQQHLEHEGPHYRQVGSSRNPPFTVGVYFKGQRLGTGVGASLRDARQKAGECALESDTLKLMGLDTRQKK